MLSDLLPLILVLLGAAPTISIICEVDLQGILTALGVGSVVLGLALQDTLSGFFQGIAFIPSRRFKQGDWLQVVEQAGRVVSTDWRSIRLETNSRQQVVIPTSVLAKQQFAVPSTESSPYGNKVAPEFYYQHSQNRIMETIRAAVDGVKEQFTKAYYAIELPPFDKIGMSYEFRYFSRNCSRSKLLALLLSRVFGLCVRAEIDQFQLVSTASAFIDRKSSRSASPWRAGW